MYNKYILQKKQVSYDNGATWSDVDPLETQKGTLIDSYSTNRECNGGTPTARYRWINIDISQDYVCDGVDKYYKQQRQVSYDYGVTWQSLEEYQAGDLFQKNSVECGYEPDGHYENIYFTIESLEDSNTIQLKNREGERVVSASTDNGQTWTECRIASGSSGTTLATLNTSDKVLIKGFQIDYLYLTFSTNKQFVVYGNIMSLYYEDLFEDKYEIPVSAGMFQGLFSGCTNLISAENLVLPATTLKLACYQFMFQGCTSLTTAPQLPATTLASQCYQSMFKGCTSLLAAPELPATTLVSNCYHEMFYNCTSLNYIKAMFTTTPSTTYTSFWVRGVASSGTFVKNSAATWDVSGNNGIPEGWTIQNA